MSSPEVVVVVLVPCNLVDNQYQQKSKVLHTFTPYDIWVELKLRCRNHCVLSVAGSDNAKGSSNNNCFSY